MLELPPTATAPRIITVSDLNRLAKDLLEKNLPLMWVAGEISNFRRYDSGHCYFTIKDEQAQVDCVMFRHKAQHLDWLPQDGSQVEVRALPSLYEARGRFQLNVEVMRRFGRGALYEAFEKLKARLAQEGLFDAAHKRPLPRFPRAIGVVTSPQAAALRDVLTTLRRRMPAISVIVYPTPVQGEGAGAKIAQAVALAGSRAECDVLIVCRGGGGIEDLWAFNEEVLARAIYACAIPVIAGVGHETDVTVADFVADARVPTPTAAAELASPDGAKLGRELEHSRRQLARQFWRGLEDRMQRLDHLAKRLVHPGERIRMRRTELAHLASRMRGGWQRTLQERVWRARELAQGLASARLDIAGLVEDLAALAQQLADAARRRFEAAAEVLARTDAHLRHLSPQQVLERGYSITTGANGKIVREADRLALKEEVSITFARGSAQAEVKSKKV
ncbi:MAG: exodeoxyribonuclease VII large subunit [Betaproteobacteria bacterium]|nr:exodeoxyribonuclease VII large subunit [Betaproteobacteria bacterium]